MYRRFTSMFIAGALVAGVVASAQPGGAVGSSGKLAFRSDRDGNDEVYVSSSDGTGQRNLTNAPKSEDVDPAWSPDGKLVAFARKSGPLQGTHILTVHAAGWGQVRLTNRPTIDRQPAWSPDGTKIAFTRGDPIYGVFQLFVMNANGSWQHPLTGATPHVFNGSPAWSPDGTKIAFVSDRGRGFPKIFLMNSDGTFPHQLSGGTWADGNPTWSPDGSLIAFDRCCIGGISSVYVMSSVGGPVTRVTDSSIDASNPSWSPDGTRIAFVGFPPGGGSKDIYTVGVDGSGLAQVTNDTWSDLSPDWQPGSVTPSSSEATAPQQVTQVVTRSGSARPARAAATATPPRKKRKHRKLVTRRTTRVAPGLTLTRIVNRKIPERIFMLKASVRSTALRMDVALSNNELPGFETVRSMAGRHHAIAAVNGDFGLGTGRPMNIFAEDGDLKQTMYGWGNNFAVSEDETKEFLAHPVQNVTATVASTGETWPIERFNEGIKPIFGQVAAFSQAGGSLIKPPALSCEARLYPSGARRYDVTQKAVVRDFVVDRAGCYPSPLKRNGGIVLAAYPTDDEALMLRALVQGETVSVAWTLGWHRVLDTVGGFPMLLRDGRIVAQPCGTRFCGRNPRTGVGFTSDGKVMMVVVDGRRDRYSKGMTLTGFAKQMRRLGAVTAMNLDGGGSSTMVVRGKVINSPSDPGGPRHVSSALLVLNGPDPGEQSSLHAGAQPQPTATTTIGTGPGALRAWRLAATDPGSTGGLVDTLSRVGWARFRMIPALARILRLYWTR